jgi:hypothetical protein
VLSQFDIFKRSLQGQAVVTADAGVAMWHQQLADGTIGTGLAFI